MNSTGNLRTGFTTGTAAQAAAKAAALMLIGKKVVKNVDVETPKGAHLSIEIIDQKIGKSFAKCAVIKDAGDDPDATHSARIYAKVRYSGKEGISITGGVGVGIVTKPGLAVSVGEYAINPTPRSMITREVAPFILRGKGLDVIISVPDGKKIARRTFNSRRGIIGGISIIGTTGMVEPRSTDAYKSFLSIQLDVLKAAGYKEAVLVLGYVGEKYCKNTLGIMPDSIVKIGDHVGFMLSECAKKNIERVLVIGHIGKLVKVANGQFDTNIKFGDNRIKTIVYYAKLCGAGKEVLGELSTHASAEAAVDILKKHNLTAVFDMIAKKAADMMNEYVNSAPSAASVLLSLNGEELSAYPRSGL